MYNKLFFVNESEPEISAENLNHMDNGIEQANRGISFGGSATFDGNGVLKSFTNLTSIGAGDFATGDTDIVTVYICSDVTTINGGAFANCPNLQTVYIDNISDNITVSIPEGVSVIYNDDENFINVNYFLAKSIKNIANRQVDKIKVAVDLNSTSITDAPVVNLSGCTVDNAPLVTGAISGTVVNFNYKVDLESIIVQFLIMRNNYTYKRTYTTSNGWSIWVLVADDMSKYLKTEDLQKYSYTKEETDTLLYDKADKSTVDNNTFDLSMLMSSLKRTATGNGVVNLTNTAENGILKVISDGEVTVKNKNMFEDILIDGINFTNCNVSYDNGTYEVEYTGSGTSTFFFGSSLSNGSPYDTKRGKKLKYNKNMSIRINCDKLTRSGCYITYYNADSVSLGAKNHSTNQAFKIDDVEGAKYFTMRIGFDYNNGAFTTGDIFHFSVQIEYGDTVSDFIAPRSNTDNTAYEGVTNVVGEGEITVEYVPSMQKLYDNLATAIVALGGSL